MGNPVENPWGTSRGSWDLCKRGALNGEVKCKSGADGPLRMVTGSIFS